MEGCPKIALTPLELLENDGTREIPFMSKYFNPAVGGVFGFTAMVVANWTSRRPFFSGIQKHIMGAVIGTAIGKILDDRRNQYFAERDAIFRHYIQLHSEEFPPYERKLIKDTFESWVPIR